MPAACCPIVMAGDVPAIRRESLSRLVAGTGPAMTVGRMPAMTVGRMPAITVGRMPAKTVGRTPVRRDFRSGGRARAMEDWYARFRAVNLNSVALRGPRTSSVLNLFGRCTEALAVQVC
jgi:hypothetical protein